jgi:hypothetical protein
MEVTFMRYSVFFHKGNLLFKPVFPKMEAVTASQRAYGSFFMRHNGLAIRKTATFNYKRMRVVQMKTTEVRKWEKYEILLVR